MRGLFRLGFDGSALALRQRGRRPRSSRRRWAAPDGEAGRVSGGDAPARASAASSTASRSRRTSATSRRLQGRAVPLPPGAGRRGGLVDHGRGERRRRRDGLKEDSTVVGESPARYGSAYVDADTLSYTIEGLESGIEYYVRVSAVNAYGRGPVLTSADNMVPQQIADSPTNVSVAVNYADSDSLTVSFDAPTSDGGAAISHYRVELDPTDTFDDPIREDFYCPTANKRTVWKVASEAPARRRPSSAARSSSRCPRRPWPTRRTRSPTTPSRCRATRSTPSGGSTRRVAGMPDVQRREQLGPRDGVGSLAGILFDGDLVTFAEQKWAAGCTGRSSHAVDAGRGHRRRERLVQPHRPGHRQGRPLHRHDEGQRGADARARRPRHARRRRRSSARPTGATARRAGGSAPSGSVEAKLEALDELLDLDVDVARVRPDDAGGYEWYVTFLDAAPESAANDFVVSINDNSLRDANGTVGSSGGRYAPRLTATLVQSGDTSRVVHGHDPGRPVGRLGPRERPAVLRARDRRQQRRVLGRRRPAPRATR